jgi:aldehyde dehydrogenase (NAD+)
MGPVVSEPQLQQDIEYIRVEREEGATLSVGGQRLRLEHEGFYLQPALFTDTHPAMRTNTQDEIFGPVASVMRARDYEHALAVANDVPFGLRSGVVTRSRHHAADFRHRSQAGMMMINLPTAGVDDHVPFGGPKGSSYGPREHGRHAVAFYTNVKTAYVAH